MRKNILKMSLAAAFVCAAGFTAYRAQTDAQTLSELALENVEALANDESCRIICLDYFSTCEGGKLGPYMQYE